MIIEAIHPGVYIKNELNSLSMSVREFSKRTGISEKQLSLLISGDANLTLDIAEKLSKFFGNNVLFWVNLQTQFERQKRMKAEEEEISTDFTLLKTIDASWRSHVLPGIDMRDVKNAVSDARRLLQASSLKNLASTNFYPIYKELRSANKGDPFLQNVWLSVAIKKAKENSPLEYNEALFRASLNEIKSLTMLSPEQFYPRLVKMFKEAGVFFMVLPHLKNTNIFGASLWIEKEGVKYPIIILSNRGHSADVFWFSLCHEVAHILMRHTKNVLINSLDTRDNPIEDEADKVGKSLLINPRAWMTFHPNYNQHHKTESVIRFSQENGIDPCIVVGWIQHADPNTKTMYKRLRKSYDFSNIV